MNYGITAEFNPFHNGHKYLFDTLKSEDDTITVVMSESFVQRGESACLRTGARVEAALRGGADLVLSLPLPFAVSSAEGFALGAVEVLKKTGIVNALAFGSECGDENLLEACADALLCENFSAELLNELKTGISYPKARENALLKTYGKELSSCLKTPNDTLAVEYIKASKKLGADFPLTAVKRNGALHNQVGGEGNIRSASEIRELLSGDEYKTFVPESAFEIYESEKKLRKAPVSFFRLERAILSKLRTLDKNDFARLPDVSEGLENRLYSAVQKYGTLKEILESVKTKRYTYSRIQRIILCAFLGITREKKQGGIMYIRVLGFSEKGERLLRKMKKCAEVPVITSYKEAKKLSPEAFEMYMLESTSRDIFALCEPQPDRCGTFMSDKIIKL